jgi:hypothetical protein
MTRRRDTGPLTVVWILLTASAAFAAEPMAPSDIQATFFNGEPFNCLDTWRHQIQNDVYAGRQDDP